MAYVRFTISVCRNSGKIEGASISVPVKTPGEYLKESTLDPSTHSYKSNTLSAKSIVCSF